jgi:hypothetical protein
LSPSQSHSECHYCHLGGGHWAWIGSSHCCSGDLYSHSDGFRGLGAFQSQQNFGRVCICNLDSQINSQYEYEGT